MKSRFTSRGFEPVSVADKTLSLHLDQIFTDCLVEVSFILENLDGSHRYIYNRPRANTPYTVASTFKIPNTLIGVQENIVSNAASVFKWDGVDRAIPTWNQDQTLASAFQSSCVWCYQSIAQSIGIERYQRYIATMQYGSLPNEFDVQNFWLDGTLKISAAEHIQFLKQLHRRALPFDASAYDVLKEVMLVEKAHDYSMYAKSGWAPAVEAPVGWYVGYIENLKDAWFFTLNLAATEAEHLPIREDLSRQVLLKFGLISNES